MKFILILITSVSSIVSAMGATKSPYTPDASAPKKVAGMKLVFSEEFNYEGAPNPEIWSCETGFQRNEELQW
jgi:hypothetical protein